MPKEKKIWFPVRRNGMSWGLPCCWQGWVVLFVYSLSIASICGLAPSRQIKTYILGVTAIFIIICLLKGGRRGSPKA